MGGCNTGMGAVGGGGEAGDGEFSGRGKPGRASPRLCLAEERRAVSTLSCPIPAPRPGPARPLTPAGSSATAPVRAQPLNPEPAEPE